MSNIKKYLCFIIVLFLCGCTTDYKRKDIKAYVKKNHNLTSAEISNDYEEVIDNNGYIDKLWQVYDSENDISFHVLDNYFYSYEVVTNSLCDDYKEAAFIKNIEGFNSNLLTYEIDTSSILNNVKIYGSFHDLEELQACYKELSDLKQYYINLGFDNLYISYNIQYINPLRYTIMGHEVSGGDTHGVLKDIDDTDNLQTFIDNYLLCALDYQFDDALNEFSKEDILNFVKTNEDIMHVGIVKDDVTYWYNDLCASRYYYGISFASLYEVLVREGFEVNGTKNHYSFVGIDNATYEISYDFGEENSYYYYLKDNNIKLMDYSFYNHFGVDTLKGMTGLTFIFQHDISIE